MFATAGAGIALLGFARGGYYATTWSWATIGALAAAGVVLAQSRTLRASQLDLVLLGSLAALAVWTGVEALRPGAATSGVPQLERTVLYLALAWAAVQLVVPKTVDVALGGALAAIVAVVGWGLVSLLLPAVVRSDPFEGRLLFLPIGYANACGILAAIGVILALGFAGREARTPRASGAAALVPLVVALELTGSHGAMVAAAAGLAAAVMLDPDRRAVPTAARFLPLPLVGAALASASHVGEPLATTSLVARDGRLVAAAVVILTGGQVVLARRAAASPRNARWALRAAAIAILVAGAAVAHHGLGGLLDQRPAYWRVAWADARAHPLLGSGPGSFAAEWLQRRAAPTSALNAHNVYLETLAELGPLGLLLLLGVLLTPIVAAVRHRSTRTAAACGAYVAFVVHAGLDWDWQLPVVVAVGLLCGACVLATGRTATAVTRRRTVDFALVCSAAVALAAGAAGVGNSTLAAAGHAAQVGSPASAARLAHVAAAWQPWSADPERILGGAYAAAGDRARARRSFERAVQLDPRDATSWYGLAQVGDRAERVQAFLRLAVLDPLVVRRVTK